MLAFHPAQETPTAATTEMQSPGTSEAPGGAGGAPTGPTPGGSAPGGFWIPVLLMFAIFYFLLIRPEKRRRKQVEDMLGQLKKGDEVMTNGGLFARVAAIHDDKVTLEVADGVRLKFSRAAIQVVLGKDAGKDEEKPAS